MIDFFLLQVSILFFALMIDAFIGEPPAPLHPVVWMGKVISLCEPRLYSGSARQQRIKGTLAAMCTISLFTIPAVLFQIAGSTLIKGNLMYLFIYVVVSAYVLKCSFSIAMLEKEAVYVSELAYNNVEQARFHLRSLVSRDRSTLTQEQVLSGICESIAENSVDSVVAPLLFFAIFGIAGAACYRVINTLDSMLGYKDHREAAGAFSARLDDVANYLPTRIALPLVLVGFYCTAGKRACSQALRILTRDSRKKEAINSGLTISLFAGGLEVKFVKQGSYAIGDGDDAITKSTVNKAISVMKFTSAITVIIAAFIILLIKCCNFVI
jgi:adenosylcobinamide-phosphate synthase